MATPIVTLSTCRFTLQTFDEYVVSLWNYCTLDRSALLLFAFDMCDLDATGEIGE